ncbi:hypothetical protein PENSPDRAFT_609592 [Peniophora sp. CONT]|nr:hypothetical protein PENSPDRAFT_609592 [Peniophora sp. CONT]
MSLGTTAMNNDTMERSTHGTTPVTPADSKHELLREHHRFFYDDGNVDFQVENVLYKVHRFFFSHYSPWFRARFQQPESDSEAGLPAGWECIDGPDGVQAFVNYDRRKTMFEPPSPTFQADSDVIVLEDVTTGEFDALLSIFYPEDLDLGDLSTQEEWVGVLRLATLWSFSTLVSRAYRELDALVTPLDRLVLARQYSHSSWLDVAVRGLCTRESPLRSDELRQMSYDDIAFVMAAREGIRGQMDEEHVHERIDEYLARRRYSSEDSGTVEESSTSRSDSGSEASGGEEVDRTELGEGDEVHLKVALDDGGEIGDALGIPLVAEDTAGTLFV